MKKFLIVAIFLLAPFVSVANGNIFVTESKTQCQDFKVKYPDVRIDCNNISLSSMIGMLETKIKDLGENKTSNEVQPANDAGAAEAEKNAAQTNKDIIERLQKITTNLAFDELLKIVISSSYEEHDAVKGLNQFVSKATSSEQAKQELVKIISDISKQQPVAGDSQPGS
ncbi:MAG: hypothetical protein LBT45_02060 [Rickettsiales bacterium]|jgi:hypothetical protein|nr:hypothetical protein [Rickettsiales bacterium]